MIRRTFLTAALALLFAPTAHAQDAEEQVRTLLMNQGFVIIRVERTFLGRIQVWAQRGKIRREIVFNRRSGEILRDYVHRQTHTDSNSAHGN